MRRPEGKGSRPYVFSLYTAASLRASQALDIAANTQEELSVWIEKIQEVTSTSEAKVSR